MHSPQITVLLFLIAHFTGENSSMYFVYGTQNLAALLFLFTSLHFQFQIIILFLNSLKQRPESVVHLASLDISKSRNSVPSTKLTRQTSAQYKSNAALVTLSFDLILIFKSLYSLPSLSHSLSLSQSISLFFLHHTTVIIVHIIITLTIIIIRNFPIQSTLERG